jgi:hypothetical protein
MTFFVPSIQFFFFFAHVIEQDKDYGTWCLHLGVRVTISFMKVYKRDRRRIDPLVVNLRTPRALELYVIALFVSPDIDSSPLSSLNSIVMLCPGTQVAGDQSKSLVLCDMVKGML